MAASGHAFALIENAEAKQRSLLSRNATQMQHEG
jgi:hypothetical protein